MSAYTATDKTNADKATKEAFILANMRLGLKELSENIKKEKDPANKEILTSVLSWKKSVLLKGSINETISYMNNGKLEEFQIPDPIFEAHVDFHDRHGDRWKLEELGQGRKGGISITGESLYTSAPSRLFAFFCDVALSATLGFAVGGPLGAVVGAVVGTIASTILITFAKTSVSVMIGAAITGIADWWHNRKVNKALGAVDEDFSKHLKDKLGEKLPAENSKELKAKTDLSTQKKPGVTPDTTPALTGANVKNASSSPNPRVAATTPSVQTTAVSSASAIKSAGPSQGQRTEPVTSSNKASKAPAVGDSQKLSQSFAALGAQLASNERSGPAAKTATPAAVSVSTTTSVPAATMLLRPAAATPLASAETPAQAPKLTITQFQNQVSTSSHLQSPKISAAHHIKENDMLKSLEANHKVTISRSVDPHSNTPKITSISSIHIENLCEAATSIHKDNSEQKLIFSLPETQNKENLAAILGKMDNPKAQDVFSRIVIGKEEFTFADNKLSAVKGPEQQAPDSDVSRKERPS